MRLTILTLGSRGDVQPFVALGLALQRAGYEIRLATHGIFEKLVTQNGLDFAPVEGNPQQIVQGDEGRAWLETEHNPFKFASGFRSLMGPVLRQAMQDGLLACQDAQALIFGGPAYYIGYSIAKKLDLPCLQAYLQPVHPSREFPSALFPVKFRGGKAFNYLTHVAGGVVFWQLLAPIVNKARQEFLELPAFPKIGPYPEMLRLKIPVLYGYSPSVIPKPKDWPDWMHVTGYWFLEQPDWAPPPGLVDFLEAGPPPVYVGFGSMAGRDPERMTGIVLDALKKSGRRGLLSSGWGGLAQADLPEDIFKIESAPHDWLFPRMAAVVHHGGAGTTAAGLAAGRPTLVIPFFGDQMFWGERVHTLDVGPRPLGRKELSVESLASAIRQASNDPTLIDRAAALGERIRHEDGSQQACRLVDLYLSQAG